MPKHYIAVHNATKTFFQGIIVMSKSYQPMRDRVVQDTTVHVVPSDPIRKMMPQEELVHRDTTVQKEQDPLSHALLATLVMLLEILTSRTADYAQQAS